MKVLIVDNFDSFTYNLYHIVSQFVDKCDVVRVDCIPNIDIDSYNKIILSPGPSLPSDYPILFEIIKHFSGTKSILGICLGPQAIAQYFGASIKNMDRVKHGVSSENTILLEDPIFYKVPNIFTIGHYHSWIVDNNNLPSTINITSKNEDDIIMSYRHISLDICGLQFHPESLLTPYGGRIIKNWIES